MGRSARKGGGFRGNVAGPRSSRSRLPRKDRWPNSQQPLTVTLHPHPRISGLWLTEDARVFRELPASADNNGYPTVHLSDVGHSYTARRHTLMAETFIGLRPAGCGVRHKNDVPGDDRSDNLEWGTQGDNVRDAIRNGKFPIGERSAMAKLTALQVGDIQRRRIAGERGCDLAAEYGVSEQSICDIHKGRTWAWTR